MQEHDGKHRAIVRYMRGIIFSQFRILRGETGCSSTPSARIKGGGNKQQADLGRYNHHYPASDRQTPKTTKEKSDEKPTCKTEYLMV